jgi:hypothetical protein
MTLMALDELRKGEQSAVKLHFEILQNQSHDSKVTLLTV